MGFYEKIAEEYDNMTRFRERVFKEAAVLNSWIDRYHFTSVLDAACGTGVHAVALANLGVRVTGADLSAAMLTKAKSHAEDFGVTIEWVVVSLQQLQERVHGPYQAIFCLGNSLPHLIEQQDLDAAFENFMRLVAPGGIVVIQILNYHRILAEQDRIVSIQRHNDKEYIRFYDFLPDRIIFNLLTIQCERDECQHTLHSTTLYPYQRAELEYALSQAGLTELEYYGNMRFQPFDEQHSTDLVIIGHKL